MSLSEFFKTTQAPTKERGVQVLNAFKSEYEGEWLHIGRFHIFNDGRCFVDDGGSTMNLKESIQVLPIRRVPLEVLGASKRRPHKPSRRKILEEQNVGNMSLQWQEEPIDRKADSR